MAIFLHKPILGNFTIVGPLIWCDNPQVRLWMISNINNNDFHHLGRSQMCAGARYVFSPSKPHSRTLCGVILHGIWLDFLVISYFLDIFYKINIEPYHYFFCLVKCEVKNLARINSLQYFQIKLLQNLK